MVILEKADGFARLIMNRPEKRNALSLQMMHEIMARLDEVGQDREIRVLILKGSGPVFCSGHDLKEFYGEHDLHYFRRIFSTCSEMMGMLAELPQPVIAQVNGTATAAGCQLVAACDLAVASEKARFATPGVKIGLFCATPMVHLVRVIGKRRALEMLLTGRFISAEEALDFGLVNRITTEDKLDTETEELARSIADRSAFTLAFGKQAFYRQLDLNLSQALDLCQEAMATNCLAEDAKEGIAAFLEKRRPVWKHR